MLENAWNGRNMWTVNNGWIFQWSTVLSHCCKEYLTVKKCNTHILLQIKYWTVWYMDHLSASLYTLVTNCQKWSDFSWLKLIGIFGVIVSLKVRQEYLNMATLLISVLFLIRSWTFSYIERLLTSSYTRWTIKKRDILFFTITFG